MNIQEATNDALKSNGVICRESAIPKASEIYGAIKPTNTYDTCILLVIKEDKVTRSCRAWNPTADDLIADDWIVLKNKV